MAKQHSRADRLIKLLIIIMIAASFALLSPRSHALEYARNAVLDNADYPGVYRVAAVKGDTAATLGIPSLAKGNLEDWPTIESPAIIMGAAVPYEVKTGPTEFTPISGGALYPPYSYFRYSIIEELGVDGTMRSKMSGFDGSYYIIRVDVSDLIADAPTGSYLHVKQEGNKALMVSLLHEGYTEDTGRATFSDALGNKVGVFSVAGGGLSMKDKKGSDTQTPYIDVILMSSGTLVAGADTGSTDPNVMTADVRLSFYVDQTQDYNPELNYESMVNTYTPGTNEPTLAQMMLDKYYKAPEGAEVTGYVVKGSDLEIEIMNDEYSPREFWSLRKAMSYYNNSPIKMICEVPVLEGLLVDGGRHVIFDVNSFDIQIANHQTTDAAALTVRNATLTLMDSFNTTGAELAVGNNARMSIEEGGTLIISDTCQVEVEYDAASIAPGSESTAPALTYGVITVEDGGEIINNGIISIEGTEGKPIDPAAPAIRDMQAAELNIKPGGKLTNNGALLCYGRLYNTGTLENNGRYNDTIRSNDPDKGIFDYHCGIQVAWKDDVTQQGVQMGQLYNGDDRNGVVTGASLVNNGDIVLVPGFLENFGTFENAAGGALYLCAVTDAVIPYQATYTPLVLEQRIQFENPISIYVTNNRGATFTNAGSIVTAQVEIIGTGRTGELTTPADGDLIYDICIDNLGQMINTGTIALDGVYTFGQMNNMGELNNKVVLSANNDFVGSLTDTSGFTDVYNGMKTGDVWTHIPCTGISITPTHTYGSGGESVQWTVNAETGEPDVEGVRYYLLAYEGNGTVPKHRYTIAGGGETVLTSPELPMISDGNAVYRFQVLDGLFSQYTNASVRVTSQIFTAPSAIPALVYNGKDQTLITTGSTNQGVLEYRLGESGEWIANPPSAKNAGTYKVYYRLTGESEATAYQSVDVVIGKKPVTVSGVDLSKKVGSALAELSYTVSGLVEGETLNGVEVSTDANKDVIGEYKITPTVTGDNPNYEITLCEGKYRVTQEDFEVIAKDKYGVFSDETTYTGFNIELTVPSGATAYYSTTDVLTAENFKTKGAATLKVQPATAGTHTVYYYVTNAEETYGVGGSKQVIIDKAQQTAPDPAILITRAESWLDSGDGAITGLTPRKMEYREKGNDGSYTIAYMETVYVMPGTYLVRMVGDENHYASPDTEVTVGIGEPVTIWFDTNSGGHAVLAPPADSTITVESDPDGFLVSGLSCGDVLPELAPTLQGANFLGWYVDGKIYDLNTPITMPTTLIAAWTPEAITFKLPADTTKIGENAFEGLPMSSVELPAACAEIFSGAFKNCSQLKQIVLPNPDIHIYPDAFENCSGVYVFAPEGSNARYLCTEQNGFVYITDVTN